MHDLVVRPTAFEQSFVTLETDPVVCAKLHSIIPAEELRFALFSAITKGYKRDAAPSLFKWSLRGLSAKLPNARRPEKHEFSWVIYEKNLEYTGLVADAVRTMDLRVLSIGLWSTDSGVPVPVGHEGIRAWTDLSCATSIPIVYTLRTCYLDSPYQFLSVALVRGQPPPTLANGFLRLRATDPDAFDIADSVIMNFPSIGGFIWPLEVFEAPAVAPSGKPPLPPKRKRPELSVDTNLVAVGTPLSVSPVITDAIWKRVKYGKTSNSLPSTPPEMVEAVCNPTLDSMDTVHEFLNLLQLYGSPVFSSGRTTRTCAGPATAPVAVGRH